MNREIIFRGKSSVTKEWVFGSLVNTGNECCIVRFNEMELDGHHIRYVSDRPFFTDQDTICQFTERYDIKLHEIFEDDIVRVNIGDATIICIVKWNKDVGAWCLLINGETQIGVKPLGIFLCDIRYKIEVIGNVFDNKDLLEE